ncbi:BsuPI-related putative proteinase inhibitor [Neobacillus niacini]|uniref:BsuPI-related putative proteinase inhibitor n=1 Tax=Neobacillus niacini TaxID=86668 RepID=UPI001C8D0CD9|nr:BsuPI-related putative proteinase inhibitor [Neobacillus niacini]MBY0144815.1 hypothetical protein [Neobacillus niacini]
MKSFLCIILFLFPFSLKGEANNGENDQRFQFSIIPIAGQDKVEFEILIKNEGDEPLSLKFPSSQYYEISVTDPSGLEVYRYSKGRFFLQALQTVKIDPYQTYRKIESWNYQVNGERVPAGQYTVTAALLSRELNDKPLSNKQRVVSKVNFNLPEENPVIRNVKATGDSGNYLITGESKGSVGLFYIVEDGHVEYITEKPIRTKRSQEWEHFKLEVHIPKDKLPDNGSLIFTVYERSGEEIKNTYPVVLEEF